MLKKITNNLINKLIPNLDKLNKLADSIESIETLEDGSLYVKYKKHVITETKGHNLTYSKDGYKVDMAKVIHMNPKEKDAMEMFARHPEISIGIIENATKVAHEQAKALNDKR